jgi:hypothetical protein
VNGWELAKAGEVIKKLYERTLMPKVDYRLRFVLLAVTLFTLVGCGGPYDEPTIDEFNGRLTHLGKPISFSPDEKVILRLVFHKNGERFGIPIKPDGTFDIGWMPIGEYSAILERSSAGGSGRTAGKDTFNIAEGLTIAEGQSKYDIELGDDFQP